MVQNTQVVPADDDDDDDDDDDTGFALASPNLGFLDFWEPEPEPERGRGECDNDACVVEYA